ncbi:MAG: HD domain-containing protein [Bacteroidales bacterium]|nr:HD domain-containing protein [Bacteroidales bacterium]
MRDKLTHPVFELVSGISHEKGVESYVIGGYVRDLILGRPSVDIDIVVVGSGIELAEAVARKIGKVKVNVFRNFGTAMLKYKGSDIEFVGARRESYRNDSRKPVVEDGSLQDDQNRRDFTINALAISLNRENYGELLDPFGGMRDMEDRIIRTPLNPDTTYSDDPLRMMRAIRFATQLDFQIEEESLLSIRRNRERIKIISQERISEELNKMLLSPRPSTGFFLMDDTGLLELIFPEFENLKGVNIMKGQAHKDNFYHTLEVLDKLSLKTDNLWLRWAAVLHDIAKPVTRKFEPAAGWTFHGHETIGSRMVPSIFKRFRMPTGGPMKYVQKLVFLHLRPIALTHEEVTDSAIRRLLFEAGDDIDDLMLLCEADITSKNDKRVKQYLNNFELVRRKLKEVEEKDEVRNFQPPVTGELIMETFSIGPCREVGMIKNAIKEAILEGEIHNQHDEAFQLMLRLGGELGLKRAE